MTTTQVYEFTYRTAFADLAVRPASYAAAVLATPAPATTSDVVRTAAVAYRQACIDRIDMEG